MCTESYWASVVSFRVHKLSNTIIRDSSCQRAPSNVGVLPLEVTGQHFRYRNHMAYGANLCNLARVWQGGGSPEAILALGIWASVLGSKAHSSEMVLCSHQIHFCPLCAHTSRFFERTLYNSTVYTVQVARLHPVDSNRSHEIQLKHPGVSHIACAKVVQT